MMHISKISALSLFVFFCSIAFSQKTAAYTNNDLLYKQGLELFDKKQFVQAQKNFSDYIVLGKSKIFKSEAYFYSAACAIELFNKDGEWQMKQFVEKQPESNKINIANFYLAKSNFRKKKYKETVDFFEKVDVYSLDKEQLAELYFKRGYSLLETGNESKAKTDFYEIKDIDNKYAFPANYYFSHISYKEKNYEIALQGFNRLINNETFGSVVPYYITQIYFIQGKYEQVVKEAPTLLKDSANIQKENEINRMIGESYFNLKKYNDALTYLKKTNLNSENKEGNYALGYCYYKINDWKNAIINLEKITANKDSLAQNAWYHLADCYLKINEKLKSKNAYQNAYQLSFDEKIKEDALYSFAKLSYELDFSPFNDAVKAFTKYLKEYPESSKKEECYNFLINVYSTSKNYSQAISSIESLGTMNPILKLTYQKLIYFKGVEYFNNSEIDLAEEQFKKSLQQNADLKLNALNQYWLGEISYIRKDYSTSIDLWKKFQLMNGASQLTEYDLSNYALGYSYFQRKEKEDYTNANISFRKFLLTKNVYDENKIIDARIRIGDSYFMNRDYAQASENYNLAIEKNKLDVDYCLYQKALCDGLNKKYDDKIKALKKIENDFPASNYLSAALKEIADTYYNGLKDQENAILYYNNILKNYPESSFAPNCYAQLGNIYYERKDDDKALDYFDKFVKYDSKSDAAKDILEAIKKIFTEKGKIDEMENYFNSIGNPLSENQLEKASYVAAYDAFYNQKNCDLAMSKWESYITKFPNGKYINEAKFSYSECAYDKNIFEKALPGYLYIIEKPRGIYSEISLTKASYLYYKDKKYKEALPLYLQMQDAAESPSNKNLAKLGAMRCAFYLNDFETALTECTKVLNIEKISPQQLAEAKYIKAKSLFETNRFDDAMLEFKAITKSAKNISGAEAYYHIAKIQFIKKDYKEVEKTINKLIGYEYSNDDWNNKGIILLSDAYIAKGDDADALVILETLIDNKPKQEYIDEAIKRLEIIKAKETEKAEKEKQAPQSDMKIKFNQTENDANLLDDLKLELNNSNDSLNIAQPK